MTPAETRPVMIHWRYTPYSDEARCLDTATVGWLFYEDEYVYRCCQSLVLRSDCDDEDHDRWVALPTKYKEIPKRLVTRIEDLD